MAKTEMHTIQESMDALGLSFPTLKLMVAEAGIEMKIMTNPRTGRAVKCLDDNDIEAIRKHRAAPGLDVRKP